MKEIKLKYNKRRKLFIILIYVLILSPIIYSILWGIVIVSAHKPSHINDVYKYTTEFERRLGLYVFLFAGMF